MLLLSAGPVFGQDVERYRQELQTYRERLANLAEEDTWGVTSADRSRVEEWLSSAEVLLAEGETEMARMRLTEAGDLLTLIEAEIGAKRLEESADEQEQKYYQLKNEVVPDLRKSIEKLESTLKDLQDEIETARRQSN
jgi:phage shock protein A